MRRNLHALGVALRPHQQAVVVEPRFRQRKRPLLPVPPDPVVDAPEHGQDARPLDRERAILAQRAVADRQRGSRLVGTEPVRGKVIQQRPEAVQRRDLAARLARALERSVGNLAQIEAEIGQLQLVLHRVRIAALVEGVPPLRVGRDRGADPAQGIDRVAVSLEREPVRYHLHVIDGRVHAHGGVVRLGKSLTGAAGLRQAEDRHRQTGLLREQQALLGDHLAPRVPHHRRAGTTASCGRGPAVA